MDKAVSEQNLKISVIIAVYNVEPYLRKCLDSVINQTYKNLEIVCIDDGSTDGCGKILDEYAERDYRVIAIHKPNGGECSARNIGIRQCTGDFISFIDGDDWLENDMYEILVSGITSDDIDISACGYFKDYEDKIEHIMNEMPVPESPMKIQDFLRYIYIRDKYRGVASYLWSRIIRRSIFIKANITFDETMVVCHDQIISAECYIKANKIVYNSKPLYHYLQREGSAVHDAERRLKNLDACKAYEYIIELYQNENVDEYIIDYVKRFYVYHASVLLKLAYEYNYSEKIEVLKSKIKKYLDVYCRTNCDKPERIEDIHKLLNMEAYDNK